MKAMILAAGKGTRLQPLTDTCPKPLIPVGGKPLIVYHLEKLKSVGITDVVINLRHLGEKIQDYLGDGKSWELNIQYSVEPKDLEVGGGICYALPLLGKDPFIIINGDIWTDYPLSHLPMTPQGLAHLVLVDNPLHNAKGDFVLDNQGKLIRAHALDQKTVTYAGISLLRPELFEDHECGSTFRLAPLLDKAISQGSLSGEYYSGAWTDVGTLERLQFLENTLALPSEIQLSL